MHIIADGLEVAVIAAVHHQGLVATAEPMPDQPTRYRSPDFARVVRRRNAAGDSAGTGE